MQATNRKSSTEVWHFFALHVKLNALIHRQAMTQRMKRRHIPDCAYFITFIKLFFPIQRGINKRSKLGWIHDGWYFIFSISVKKHRIFMNDTKFYTICFIKSVFLFVGYAERWVLQIKIKCTSTRLKNFLFIVFFSLVHFTRTKFDSV